MNPLRFGLSHRNALNPIRRSPPGMVRKTLRNHRVIGGVQLHMRRSIACLFLLPALLLTACGDDTNVDAGADPSPTDSSDPGDDAGGDATQVAISIEVGGGFVPFGYDFAAVPTVIHDNGTAFTGGMTTAIFPGPALSPVLTGVIDADELAALLDAAEQVGLGSDAELDTGQPGITDLPTTTIKVRVDGQVYEHSVYALSYGTDFPGDVATGITDEQAEVRAAIAGFVSDVNDAVGAVASEPYTAEAYEVLAQPVGEDDQTADVAPNELEWPLATPIQGDGTCMQVDGDDAVALADALEQATQITQWTDPSDGAVYLLTVRAVIPGFDREC